MLQFVTYGMMCIPSLVKGLNQSGKTFFEYD